MFNFFHLGIRHNTDCLSRPRSPCLLQVITGLWLYKTPRFMEGEKQNASLKCKYSSRALGQHKLGICNPEKALHLSVQSINKKKCKSLYFASFQYCIQNNSRGQVHFIVLVFSDLESSSLVYWIQSSLTITSN